MLNVQGVGVKRDTAASCRIRDIARLVNAIIDFDLVQVNCQRCTVAQISGKTDAIVDGRLFLERRATYCDRGARSRREQTLFNQ